VVFTTSYTVTAIVKRHGWVNLFPLLLDGQTLVPLVREFESSNPKGRPNLT